VTLLAPPTAPLLSTALEAVARRDADAATRLAAAVAADEEVLLPTSDDGRHPLSVSDLDGAPAMTAFTGLWPALWSQPWRPPLDTRRVSEVLGWVASTGRAIRLDHASEADTRIDAPAAAALLDGRAVVDAAALAAGDPFRRPGPPAAPPSAPLPAPEADASAHDGDITYGRGWDADARRVVGPVSLDELAAVPDLVGGYVAVRTTADATEVVRFADTEVRAHRLSGGLVHVWAWARFAEGLFLTETSVAHDDGSRRPRPHLVVLSRPDGAIRTWRDLGDGTDETITSASPDLSDRWIGIPPLGVLHPLLDHGV
jgi:hypothetical protein